MARAKRWADLTPRTREKYAQMAVEGKLFPSREAARKSFNRGTWNPGSPKSEQRVPAKFRHGIDWKEQAQDNMRGYLGDRPRWAGERSDRHIEMNTENATEVALIAMANATENELRTWASAGSAQDLSDSQREREALKAHPGWKKPDVGYFDSRQNWHSIFWYHSN